MEPTAVQTPLRVTTEGWKNLPAMNVPATDGFIGDVYENPDGSEMCSGYFELKHTDEPLRYVYGYDEMKVVLEGEFPFENKDTGQVRVASPKDAIFFRKGSRISSSTPSYGLAFYCGHRSADLGDRPVVAYPCADAAATGRARGMAVRTWAGHDLLIHSYETTITDKKLKENRDVHHPVSRGPLPRYGHDVRAGAVRRPRRQAVREAGARLGSA